MLARLLAVVVLSVTTAAHAVPAAKADARLTRALQRLVDLPEGPPGVIAIVQRGDDIQVHTAGVASFATLAAPRATDHMRIASVAKAFSGAVALALVQQGVMSLDETIGQRRPDLPAQWHGVTLRELLHHTSGVPDFLASKAAQIAVGASLTDPPSPRAMLDFVKDVPLKRQGKYHYSNSDNIIVGLMVETATGIPYHEALARDVSAPLGLVATSLPRGVELPAPFIHGYEIDDDEPPLDLSEIFAAGWAWASGGIVSTPADLNRFIRGYVGKALFGDAVAAEQRRFIRHGKSDPVGPGRNAAGLALFRYRTRCGTMYGHTGNIFGYTHFAAASEDGTRSATVSINAQRTQDTDGREKQKAYRFLREAEVRAVCAALAR
jgi:D-alanyl-D-alanine carboxypeptidase